MESDLIDQIDSIDKSLMLVLNYDGGYVQDYIWQGFSSRLLWILPALLLIIHLFRHQKPEQALTIIAAIALTVVLCDQVSSGLIKPLFARLRPSHNPEIAGLLHYVNGYHGGMYGFVSSHTANSFGVTTYVALLLRRRWVTFCMVLLSIAVGYSRIYLGVHYPGDVMAGGLLGGIIGACCYKMWLFYSNNLKQRLSQYQWQHFRAWLFPPQG